MVLRTPKRSAGSTHARGDADSAYAWAASRGRCAVDECEQVRHKHSASTRVEPLVEELAGDLVRQAQDGEDVEEVLPSDLSGAGGSGRTPSAHNGRNTRRVQHHRSLQSLLTQLATAARPRHQRGGKRIGVQEQRRVDVLAVVPLHGRQLGRQRIE